MSSDKPGKGLGMGLSALLGDAARRQGDEASGENRGGRRTRDRRRTHPAQSEPAPRAFQRGIDQRARRIRSLSAACCSQSSCDPTEDGFEIVAGERRWRAAQRARLHTIPAIVREIDEASMAELALIENIQREDLNAIEEADGYRQLIERHGHTQDGVAKIVHKSRSHVANLLRLLDLPDFVRQSLVKGDITMGHARAVATAPDPEALTQEIVAKGLSVRQAEDRAKQAKSRGPGYDIGRASARNASKTVDADLVALERQLGDLLGVKVQVSHKGQGGQVTLHYSSLDQLDMICQRLSGEPI